MRKTLFILVCLLWHLTSKAQLKSLPCDTCARQELQKQKEKTDSAIRAGKQEIIAGADSLVSKNQRKVKGISGTYKRELNSRTDSSAKASYKNRISSRTDSSARQGMKRKAVSAVGAPVSKVKSLPGEKWKKLKSKLPEKKNIIKFSGEVRSESYYTTAQNPLMRNEPVYSRLYISPTVTLLGLPFKANFFLTTESNNTWKSNFFSIRFDANAMRQQAAADIQKQLDEARKIDRIRQVDLQKNAVETQRYQEELDRMKGQLPNVDNLENELKAQAEARAKSYIDKEKAELEKKLKNATEEEKARLQNEYRHKQDSIVRHYKQQAGDSLLSVKDSAMSAVDTAKLGKYLRMQRKLDELKAQKQKIDDLRQSDSAQLLKKISANRNPDDLRKMAKDQLPDKKLLTSILAVDRFGIGLVNPQYSEFTLFAASVKGIDIGVNKDKYFYDLTIGRTTRQFTGLFSNTRPKYDRNIAVARLGLGELKGNYLSLEYLYAYDAKATDNVTPMIRNGVANLSGRFTMLKRTTVEANLAQSDYKEQYVQERSNYTPSNARLDGSANRAYQIKATQEVGENTKVEIQMKQTGAAFRSVGNPFLRRNFREGEFKFEQQFFKKKVKFSGFYKEMRDNLVELNTSTNRLKGYGLKLSTNFEKYPNITASYSPYQQGNNHPDSLYRTNNQFSITTAMITYKKRFRTVNWNGLVNYTRSAMEINGAGTVAYKMISSVHTLQIGQRHTGIISYMSNITAPFVDSLNSNSVQLSYTYLAKRTLSAGVIGEYTAYKNDALKAGGGLQVTTALLKNFTLSLVTRYDRIHKLWQLQEADVFTGKMILVWRW